jgi:O-antigen ligase
MQRRFVFLMALTVALGYAAIQRAGIDPETWNACLLAIGLIVGVYGLVDGRREVGKFDGTIVACLAIILGIVGLQLVPLPRGVVHMLSPTRFELYAAAERLAGGHAHLVTLTATPYETAEYLLTLSGYALVIVFVWHLRRTWHDSPWLTVWPLLVVSGLEAALGCYQAYVGAAADGARGTYMNRDHFSALLEMSLPFALTYPLAALQNHQSRNESPVRPAVKACVGIALFVLLLSGILLSFSRGAFLASLAATLAVLAGIFLVPSRGDGSERTTPRWVRWAALATASALIVVGFIFLPKDSFVARFAELPSTEGVSSEIRLQIWKDTTRLVRAYPLFGCGAGSYGSCFLRYKNVAPMQTVDYAHNDYLQVLAEFGLFGFVAGLILVARFVLCGIRGARRASSADERYVAIACLGAIVAILLHSFVDFNMYVPANGFEFAWILGIAAAYRGSVCRRNVKAISASAYDLRREMVVSTT